MDLFVCRYNGGWQWGGERKMGVSTRHEGCLRMRTESRIDPQGRLVDHRSTVPERLCRCGSIGLFGWREHHKNAGAELDIKWRPQQDKFPVDDDLYGSPPRPHSQRAGTKGFGSLHFI